MRSDENEKEDLIALTSYLGATHAGSEGLSAVTDVNSTAGKKWKGLSSGEEALLNALHSLIYFKCKGFTPNA